MKIVQIAGRYKKGDGVGNAAAAIDEFLKSRHYEAYIFDRQLEQEDIESELFSNDTIVLYHLAYLMDPIVAKLRCRKVLVFHNITNPELLEGIDEEDRIGCSAGLYDAAKTVHYFDKAITFSEYSKSCLIEMGWRDKDIFTVPIFVRLNKFSMEPSREIVQKYRGNSVNILFTGRVYPNKKQEDIIAVFAAYRELYNSDSKLFLVGDISKRKYYSALCEYAKKLGVAEDVIFPGHVSFADYLAYYNIADVYLCMSEHEGFCIPLVEAMYFKIPIVAYGSTAIPDTLSGSGVLLDSKKPEYAAKIINEIVKNQDYSQVIVDGQNARMKQLCPETLKHQYAEMLDAIIRELERKPETLKKSDSRSNKYQFVFRDNLMEQIGRHGKEFKQYAIYGAGAAGVKLFRALKREVDGDRLIICDSFKSGEFNTELACRIFSPKEAVEICREDAFIISIQDKRAIMEIVLFLAEQGISKEQIFLYDMLANLVL